MTRFYPKQAFVLAGVLLGVIPAVGCRPPEVKYNRVWPPPPAPARFRLVQIIRGASDLGPPGFFEAISNITTGRSKQGLLRPQGIAIEPGKQMYICDVELRGVHVLDLHSSKSSFISSAAGLPLMSPAGIAVCDGMLAVSDSVRKEVFLLTPSGELVRTIEKPGGFQRPTGLAFFARKKLLCVVDTLAAEVCVFDLSGRLVHRFGSRGKRAGQFNYPTHIFVDQSGRIYVTDSLNFRVQVFDPDGRYLFEIGKQGDASGYLGVPKGVAVDRFGYIYIADSYFSTVHVFDQKGRFLLAFGEPGNGPGSLQLPCGIAVGSKDRIFVCDSYNQRVQVFQYVGANDAKPSSER